MLSRVFSSAFLPFRCLIILFFCAHATSSDDLYPEDLRNMIVYVQNALSKAFMTLSHAQFAVVRSKMSLAKTVTLMQRDGERLSFDTDPICHAKASLCIH